jgi:hypothetical protein
MACKQKQQLAYNAEESEIAWAENTFNSRIEARILDRFKADVRFGELYAGHYCLADVLIEKIVQNGQNYHGQFEEGDTLRLFFSFTLESTESLFPELEHHLPGVRDGDIFEAELTEKEGEPQFTVYLYQLKSTK